MDININKVLTSSEDCGNLHKIEDISIYLF